MCDAAAADEVHYNIPLPFFQNGWAGDNYFPPRPAFYPSSHHKQDGLFSTTIWFYWTFYLIWLVKYWSEKAFMFTVVKTS